MRLFLVALVLRTNEAFVLVVAVPIRAGPAALRFVQTHQWLSLQDASISDGTNYPGNQLLSATVAQQLSRLLKQFPPDQHAADLGSAGTDFIKFGIAQQTSGRIVVDVTVAAEQLDRIECA
jgi:hypothetical protein